MPGYSQTQQKQSKAQHTSMAAGGKMELRMLGSFCFTLAALLMIATFSLEAGMTAASAEPATTILSRSEEVASAVIGVETRRSLIDWGSIAQWLLDILNSIRKRIVDEILQILGFPPSGDIFWFLVKAVKFIYEKLKHFFKDPSKPYNIAMEWLIDSAINPFRSIKKGVKSFQVLFRFLHKLRKGTHAGFGMDNLVYRCYLNNYPSCVKQATKGSMLDWVIYQFYCAWQFYEECNIHYWWKKGKWRAPNVNLENDPCQYHPRGKCPDNPPKN